ncbi:hypothetical protein, partial [Kitasatospora sp. SC0581]|uniref:hypothetical protein n=1 Tax=Kitasatospora sp. SC0581 TaxID=3394360 RepID=UPI003A869874
MPATPGGPSSRLVHPFADEPLSPRRQRAAMAGLLALLAVITTAEFLTPPPLRVILLAGLVPVLGSLLLSVRRTAV